MKGVALTVALICTLLVTLTAGHIWIQYSNAMLTNQQAYEKGFKDGKRSAHEDTPKLCVAWWFQEDAKLRHQQAVEAYCKGKK